MANYLGPAMAYGAGRDARLDEETQQKRNALFDTQMQNSLQDRQKAQEQEGYKRHYVAAQYALNAPNPKAFMEQNFPDIVQEFGPQWGQFDDNGVRQVAQGVLAKAGANMGVGPPQQEHMTPYQEAQIGLEQQKLNAPKTMSPYEQATIGLKKQELALKQNENNPMGIGNPQATAGGPRGAEFLQTIPPNIASQVKALAEGRMAFPAGMALKSPYWQQMLSAVSQYDPNFDAVNYNARSKTRNDFTSGKGAQNIKSLNTAIGHLGTLEGQIKGTHSARLQAANALDNAFSSSVLGSAGPTQFKQTAGALASELTQVFRGSGGAEADVKRYLEELNVNASLEQKQAAVKNIVDLLHSRLEAIGDQYNNGMGTTEDPLTLLNPKAQATIRRLEGSGAPGRTVTRTGTLNGRKVVQYSDGTTEFAN